MRTPILHTVILEMLAENNGGLITTKKIHSDSEEISWGMESHRQWGREADMFVMAGWALACGWVEIKNSLSWAYYDLRRFKYQFESLQISFGTPFKRGWRRDGRREIERLLENFHFACLLWFNQIQCRMLQRGQWRRKTQQHKTDRQSGGGHGDRWLKMWWHIVWRDEFFDTLLEQIFQILQSSVCLCENSILMRWAPLILMFFNFSSMFISFWLFILIGTILIFLALK